MTGRIGCTICHPNPLAEMVRTTPALMAKLGGHARRAMRAKSKRRRRDWLRAMPTAVRVWALPLGVKTVQSRYHPDHPQHFTSCARAMRAHYPGVDINALHHVTHSRNRR